MPGFEYTPEEQLTAAAPQPESNTHQIPLYVVAFKESLTSSRAQICDSSSVGVWQPDQSNPTPMKLPANTRSFRQVMRGS